MESEQVNIQCKSLIVINSHLRYTFSCRKIIDVFDKIVFKKNTSITRPSVVHNMIEHFVVKFMYFYYLLV